MPVFHNQLKGKEAENMHDEYDNDVLDEYGRTVSPLDDDYDYYKRIQESTTDPLDDDYSRYWEE